MLHPGCSNPNLMVDCSPLGDHSMFGVVSCEALGKYYLYKEVFSRSRSVRYSIDWNLPELNWDVKSCCISRFHLFAYLFELYRANRWNYFILDILWTDLLSSDCLRDAFKLHLCIEYAKNMGKGEDCKQSTIIDFKQNENEKFISYTSRIRLIFNWTTWNQHLESWPLNSPTEN